MLGSLRMKWIKLKCCSSWNPFDGEQHAARVPIKRMCCRRALLVLAILLGACWFWGLRRPRVTPPQELPMDKYLNISPAIFKTVTTTVNANISQEDAAELTWEWRYDNDGHLSEIVRPGGVTSRIEYEPFDTETEGKVKDGQRRQFAYDEGGRLLSAGGTDGNVSFKYYTTGMPAEIRSDEAPLIRYIYDVQDRLVEMHIGDEVIRYRYDYLNRLATINTPTGEITYRYQNATNTLIRRLPNGIQTFREYDDEGMLAKLTHADSKNYIIAEYEYAYRPDGLIKRITERNQRHGERVFQYEYDRMQRLTAVRGPNEKLSHRYGYDVLGNLAESKRGDNRPLSFTSAPTGDLSADSRGVTWTDSRGHIRQLPVSPKSIDYDFSRTGELTSARGNSLCYTYNALGLMTARSVNGHETRYLPDPFADAWQPLWRLDAGGSETIFVWDGAVPLLEIQGKEVRYRLEDHLGSTRVKIGSGDKIEAWCDYTPYGSPEDTGIDSDLMPGFAGLFWDPAAQVYLTMARAYDPVTARFLQPDPQLRLPDTSKHNHSLYAYCGGDPLNFSDRNGAEAEWAIKEKWDNFSLWAQNWVQPAFKTFWEGSVRDTKEFWYAAQTKEFWKTMSQWRVDVFDSDYLALDKPEEPPQRYDDGTAFKLDGSRLEPGEAKRFFQTKVSEYMFAELQKPKYKGQDIKLLSQANQIKIWKHAADKFAENYSAYSTKIVKLEFEREYYDYVFNMNIATKDGWSNQDWLTTTRDAKRKFKLSFMSHKQRQWIGKVSWNLVGPRLGRKEFPDGSVFEIPLNNINSVRLNERLDKMPVSSAVAVPPGFRPENIHKAKEFTNVIMSQIKDMERIQKKFEISDRDWQVVGSGEYGSSGAYKTPFSWQSLKQSIPSPIDILGSPTLSGSVLMSTTGPGKRGGRGGGITRPPSWKPPGSQGRPGPGPQPPLGGKPVRGGRGHRSSLTTVAPSRVGGVYLGGMGKALKNLGQLKGVAVDESTGKVVLIGSDDKHIALPPLRLDDVVTVFRAVYNHGVSPTVTIDPDEDNPKGPIMHIKHDPGTAATYVGWILFECDRVMKTLQLGKDNITGHVTTSQVPGYTETLDAVFFGDRLHEGSADGVLARLFGKDNALKSNWERFWIVPAGVSRYDAASGLSLFKVPLKVNTQKMRWKNGQLVDDDKGESSAGARAFSKWFTEHYAEIADETLLKPPPASGMEAPVAIFHELQRIALITAIAERLRDQGESMPLWMHDYPVASFPIPKTTPSLTIEKTKTDGSLLRTATIYGGVNLAPADKDVRTYSDAKETKSPTHLQKDTMFVGVARREAKTLTLKIPELAYENKIVEESRTITTSDGTTLTAAVLPGAHTRALASNRQSAVDITVPIGLGRNINFIRHYNSFFDPVGEFGKGWTLDLPELQLTKMPVKRDGKKSEYRAVYHLLSPLGSVDIRFDRIDRVEPYDIKMAVAAGHPEIAGVGSGPSVIAEATTRQVLFRDGTEWHFDDENGRLVLIQADGMTTRYVRNADGRINRIAGYIGKDEVAGIQLGYDSQGRIIHAIVTQTDYLSKQTPALVSELIFEYGDNGRLTAVIHPETNISDTNCIETKYTYRAGRLTGIISADGAETSFRYNNCGQLIWKKQGNHKREYTVETAEQGMVFTNSKDEGGVEKERWTYDACMRPVKADLGGGHTIEWKYGKDHEVSKVVSQDDELVLAHLTSPDGCMETTKLADGSVYRIRRNAAGQPTTLSRNGHIVAEASWRPAGELAALRFGDTEVRPRRHKDGWPNGILVCAPMKEGETKQWLEEEWDRMGRPVKIKDSSGFEYVMDYDDQGRLVAYGRLNSEGKRVGTKLVYDKNGWVANMETSKGKAKWDYSEGGVLKKYEVERQGATSMTTFDAFGRPATRLAFDSGLTTWHYNSDEPGVVLSTVILPNGARISYQKDGDDKADHLKIGLGPAAVRSTTSRDGRMIMMTWGHPTHAF